MPSLQQAYTRVLISFAVLIVGMVLAVGIVAVGSWLGDRDAGGTFGGIVGFIVFVAFAMTFLRGTAIWALAKGHPADSVSSWGY